MTLRAKAYGDKLAAARRAAGLTQVDVAKRVGIAQSTYAKWEAGESDLQAIHLRPLAKALGVPLEDVVPESGERSETADPTDRIGLVLIQRVASAIEGGRLGSRQARVLIDLLDELAPEQAASPGGPT